MISNAFGKTNICDMDLMMQSGILDVFMFMII